MRGGCFRHAVCLLVFSLSHTILKEGSREGLPMVDSRISPRGKLVAEAGKVFPLEVCQSAACYRLFPIGRSVKKERTDARRKARRALSATA